MCKNDSHINVTQCGLRQALTQVGCLHEAGPTVEDVTRVEIQYMRDRFRRTENSQKEGFHPIGTRWLCTKGETFQHFHRLRSLASATESGHSRLKSIWCRHAQSSCVWENICTIAVTGCFETMMTTSQRSERGQHKAASESIELQAKEVRFPSRVLRSISPLGAVERVRIGRSPSRRAVGFQGLQRQSDR